MRGELSGRGWIVGLALLVAGGVLTGCSTGVPVGADINSGSGSAAQISFVHDQDVAMNRAASEGKPVMVKVYTDWCGVCKRMDEEVLKQSSVVLVVQDGFVPLKVNPETSERGAEFARKHNVEAYPTVLFLNAEGEEVHRIVGFAPEQAFLTHLEAADAQHSAASAGPFSPARG
jgi:thiol:disulfide interchange protein